MIEKIKSEVENNKIMIFMKGTPMFPQCGFSSRVVQIFQELGVEFKTMNIFDHEDIKPSLVSYSDWPTTPQVFINGKFVGGCDIVEQMHMTGELQKLLE